MKTVLSTRGQIVIPAEFRHQDKLEPGPIVCNRTGGQRRISSGRCRPPKKPRSGGDTSSRALKKAGSYRSNRSRPTRSDDYHDVSRGCQRTVRSDPSEAGSEGDRMVGADRTRPGRRSCDPGRNPLRDPSAATGGVGVARSSVGSTMSPVAFTVSRGMPRRDCAGPTCWRTSVFSESRCRSKTASLPPPP